MIHSRIISKMKYSFFQDHNLKHYFILIMYIFFLSYNQGAPMLPITLQSAKLLSYDMQSFTHDDLVLLNNDSV